MMKFGIVLTLFAFASFAAAYANDRESCNEDTKCMRFGECSQLFKPFQELKKKADRKQLQDFVDYLRNQSCGFDEDDKWTPMVCCPLKKPAEGGSSDDSPLITEHNQQFQCGLDLRNKFYGYQADLNEQTWIAMLEYDSWDGWRSQKKVLCSGVLVSDRYVLTSSACVNSPTHKITSVILGENDLETAVDCTGNNKHFQWCVDAPLKIDVGNIITERGLALIELKKQVKFSESVQPICLPENEKFKSRLPFEVAGWSKSMIPGEAGVSKKLQSIVKRLSDNECQARVPFDPNSQICAGTSSQKACLAGAGGPLMGSEMKKSGNIRITVVGVSAMNLSCTNPNTRYLPGVFEKVSGYMKWIRKYVK